MSEPKRKKKRGKRRPGRPRDRGANSLAPLGGATLRALGMFLSVFGLPGGGLHLHLVVSGLRGDVERIGREFSILRSRGLVDERHLRSPEFAFRIHDVLARLLRTAQEEKRRHLGNALLHCATGRWQEDDITVLLPLVEALSLGHFIVIDDLLQRCDPPVSYLNPEDRKLWTCWERIRGRFPEGDDAKHIYQSIVADLEGRGLLKRSFLSGEQTEDRPLYPSLQAKRLLRFVRSPIPDGAA